MPIEFVSSIRFGTTGLINFSGNRVSRRDLQSLVGSFEGTQDAVSVTWNGAGIGAFTSQHCEDALVRPGQYKLSIPCANSCHGILQGYFFNGFEDMKGYVRRLQSISREMVSGYSAQGLRSLSGLNGAWTAVVFDKKNRRAVFARDEAGVETLYVAPQKSQIVFASDLRVLRTAGLTLEYDEQALLEFMHFLYVPSPRSAYRGVTSVLPGHALIVDLQGIRQERYVSSRFVQGARLGNAEKIQSSIQQYLPSFEERMLSAAESCIPQQGRVGLLLSAGKDSSSLAIVAKEVVPNRVIALTVGSPNPETDESVAVARMCKFLGIPHRSYVPKSDELIPGFLKLVACQDQPMGDPASLPLFLALHNLPEDVSIVWDGTGNDYYFGSVRAADEYRDAKRQRYMRWVPGFAWPVFLKVMQLGPARFASTARDWQTPLEEAFVSWQGWTSAELERLWQRDVDWSDTYLSKLIHENVDKGWVTMQTEIYGSVWTPSAAFRKTVYATRAAGLAVRMPLIDNRLVKFVNGLPQELQYLNYSNKTLLRAYLAKHLPNDLVQRPKGDFPSSQSTLLQRRNGYLLCWLRESGILRVFSSWSDAYLAEMLSEYQKHPENYVDKMYALALLSIWTALSRDYSDWKGICGS